MWTNGSPQATSSLDVEALHYVSGEMDVTAAQCFEARLADSQEARDALVVAMKLSTPLTQGVEPRPDPRWRLEVHRRLLRKPKSWSRLRPVAWMATGALAASLAFVAMGWSRVPARPDVAHEARPSFEGILPPAAVIYSELSNTDRMVRVMDEHAHKKHKLEEIRTHGWNENAPPSAPRGSSM